MKYFGIGALVMIMALPVMAADPTMLVSLAVRETGSTAAIGEPGGTSGGIEWIDKDEQVLVLDGTWQYFEFDMLTADVAAFAGATANGALDGDAGVIEHIRLVPGEFFWGHYDIYLDEVQQTYDPAGLLGPTTTVFGDFEAPLVAGDVAMFQSPSYSGSTDGYIADSAIGVVDTVAHAGTQSVNANFNWESAVNGSNWCRWTTHNAPNGGLPTVKFTGDAAVVGFWMMGTPEPASLALLAIGGLAIFRRR